VNASACEQKGAGNVDRTETGALWIRGLRVNGKDQPAAVEIYRGGKEQRYERPLPQPVWSWSYRREAQHFIEQVRAGGPFRSSGEDTLADVRLFEEIYRAYLQARRVL
jgi:predicted dehydrogenase